MSRHYFYKDTKALITGDETRYLLYSYSIFKNGTFQLTEAEWNTLYTKAAGYSVAYPWIGDHEIGHPIYLSTLLSPVSYFFSIKGLRAASFIAGIWGLWSLFRLGAREPAVSFRAGALAVFVAATTMPLLPYLRLFYMESFLFAFVSAGWLRIHRAGTDLRGDLITALIILAIPFIHLRGSVVAVALFAIFMIRLLERRALPRAAVLSGVAAAAALTLIVLNILVYGVITGSVNTARPPSPAESLSVIAMQWFNLRHGLIAFAPIWLLGYAGLVGAAFKGKRLGVEGLALATVALFTSIGPNPGECWPARFWVTSIPMLTIGLTFWLSMATSISQRFMTIALGAIGYANTIIFLLKPNVLIENRQASGTYETIYRKTGLHFGLVLPVELGDIVNADIARNLMIAAVIFIAVAALSFFRKRVAFAAAAMVLAVFDLARAKQLDPAAYSVATLDNRLVIHMNRPSSRPLSAKIGPYWSMWPDPVGTQMSVQAMDLRGDQSTWYQYPRPIISASCRDGISDITIGLPADTMALVTSPVVYQRRSLIGWATAKFSSGCGT